MPDEKEKEKEHKAIEIELSEIEAGIPTEEVEQKDSKDFEVIDELTFKHTDTDTYYRILRGKGKHMAKATQMAGKDSEKMIGYLMQMLVVKSNDTINWNRITVEEMEDYPMKLYSHIMGIFAEVNF